MSPDAPPRVFISYSHDSPAHEERVLALANRLRADGIDASIDQYETFPTGGWRAWMRDEIREARFVLSVCTETYRCRVEGDEETSTGLGATREGQVIDQELYDSVGRNKKFLPVLLDGGSPGFIPDFLRPYRHFVLDREYGELAGFLFGRPNVKKAPLGVLMPAPLEAKPRREDYRNAFWNLRPRNPFFSGRLEYLEELRRALNAAGTAALPHAIRGLGGVGKTETAIEYAYRHRGEYRAAFFLTADSAEAVVSGFAGLTDLVAIPPEQDLRRLAQRVREWFRASGGWLLILDNVERTKDIEEWIPEGGHVLLTTRLLALGRIAAPLRLEKMSSEEGGNFLLARARVADASEKEHAAARALAVEVGGLPLALDQAGAYMESRQVTATEYLAYYRREGPRLRAEAGEDAAHASVSVIFRLAAERPSERARDIVRLCAFLAPEAIPEEILTGGEEADLEFREAMAEASRYSLVERDARERLVDMHRLVHEVIRDGMDEAERRRWAERAVDAVTAVFPLTEFHIPVTEFETGIAFRRMSWRPDWDQCERLLPHARFAARWIAEYAIETPRAARLLNQTAYYLAERGEYEAAEPLYRWALHGHERLLGKEHPDTLLSVNNLAALLRAKGDSEAAEPLYRRALDACERVLGEDHLQTLISINSLAMLLDDKGDLTEAEPLYRRALDACERVLGKEHPQTLISVNNLALLLDDKGDMAGAEPLYRQALETRERLLGQEHSDTLRSVNNLAALLYSKGHLVAAESLYLRALEGFRRALGPDHSTTRVVASNYARCLAELGKTTAAEPPASSGEPAAVDLTSPLRKRTT
jgi:tetratricopeptide (TPR) repeat protein